MVEHGIYPRPEGNEGLRDWKRGNGGLIDFKHRMLWVGRTGVVRMVKVGLLGRNSTRHKVSYRHLKMYLS